MRAPAVVVAAVLASSVGIAWAAQRPADPVGGAGHLLPTDGGTSVDRISLEGDGDGDLLVSEHARQRGAEGVVSLPAAAGNAVIAAAGALGVDLDRISLWRVTSHRLSDDEVSGLTTSLYLDAPQGLYLVGSYGGRIPFFYDPPIEVVPASPTVGDTWEGTGDALPGSILTYEASAEVVAVEDDCVTTRLALRRDLDGELFDDVDTTDRWCAGRGSVAGEATFTFLDDAGDEMAETVSVEAIDTPVPPATPDGVVPRPPSLGDAGDWQITPVSAVRVDDLLGDQAIGGTIGFAPVVAADGRLLTPLDSGDDVVAFRPEGDRLVEAWRAHPGGQLLAAAAVGDTLVTSTTDRLVVGHDATGLRRWQHRTDDLVLADAVGAPGGLAVVVGLDGTVTALDVADGSVAWSADLVTDADLPAVTVDDVVVATDRNGTVIALDPADGSSVWETSGDPVDVLAAGPDSTVVTADESGRVTAIAAATGDEVWSARIAGFAHSIQALGDLTVVATGSETVAFDATGERVWSTGAVETVTGDGDLAVTVDDGVVEVLDRDGTTAGSWTVEVEDGVILYATVTEGAVWLVTSSGTYSVLGPEAP